MNLHWWFPALCSAFVLGFYDVCKKHAVRDNSVMPVLFLSTLSGSCFFIAAAVCSSGIRSVFTTDINSFILIMIKSLIVSASWICVYYAMRELPISLASPIRSSAPLWTAVGGIWLFGELPTFIQGLGMLIVLTGYIMFSFLGGKEGFNWKSRGMIFIIAGTLLGACSALYDKYLLNTLHLDRKMLQIYFSLDLVFILGAAYGIRRLFGAKHPFVWRWSIPATGILLIAADYIYFYALSLPDAPISMVSLVRRCSCVITFALGVRVFHDVNIKRKAVALALLLTGVILLAAGR